MKSDNSNKECTRLHIDDSQLPDIFLIKYAQDLGKNALLVYLWINMIGKTDSFDEDTVRKLKIIPDEEIDKALAELLSVSLISRNDKTYSFDDIKVREVEEYAQALNAKDNNSDMHLNSDEQERTMLADSISKTFYQGELPYIFYRLIDKCLYEYKFDGIVCYKLFEEGYEQTIHRSNILMENMARSWYEKGYTDIESLENQLEINKRIKSLIKLTGSLMRKRLNGLDIDRVKEWAEEYGATEELVTQAFKDNEFRSNLTLKNVGDTLKKWHDQGVKTVEDAIRFSEEEHRENKRKASRKKPSGGASWRTGEEAGLNSAAKAEEAQESIIPDSSDSGDDKAIPTDILDMFGD